MKAQQTPTIGNYKIIETLGEGGQGCVFKVQDTDKNIYAVKMFIKEHKRFYQTQSSILKKISHPCIPKFQKSEPETIYINAQGDQKICSIIVMEYIHGQTLYQYIATSGKFSEVAARTYFCQLLNIISYLHKNNFGHRDIKAANILLSDDYKLKLIDFGFTVQLKQLSTLERKYVGTPGYMAPEIHQKSYNVIKTDIFAVGVVLFMMITGGTPPFLLANDDFYKFIKLKRWDKYWSAFEKYNVVFSPEFKSLFQRLVCYDPSQRLSIDEIAKHPWIKGQGTLDYPQIKQQFNQRKKYVTKRHIIKKEKSKKKKSSRIISDQVTKGVLTQQELAQFEQFKEKYVTSQIQTNLPQIKKNPKYGLVIQEDIDYAFPSVLQYLHHATIYLTANHQQQQQMNKLYEPAFLAKSKIQVQGSKIKATFKSLIRLQIEQDQQIKQIKSEMFVNFEIQFGYKNNLETKEKNIVIDIKCIQGDYFGFLRIVTSIKQEFLYLQQQ